MHSKMISFLFISLFSSGKYTNKSNDSKLLRLFFIHNPSFYTASIIFVQKLNSILQVSSSPFTLFSYLCP